MDELLEGMPAEENLWELLPERKVVEDKTPVSLSDFEIPEADDQANFEELKRLAEQLQEAIIKAEGYVESPGTWFIYIFLKLLRIAN